MIAAWLHQRLIATIKLFTSKTKDSELMMNRSISCALLALVFCNTANAQIPAQVVELPVRAFLDVTIFNPLPDGTLINTPGQDLEISTSGTGIWGLDLDAQTSIGSDIDWTITDAVFTGFNPIFGQFQFGAVGGIDPANYGGVITNVVNDPSDSTQLSSGEMRFSEADYVNGTLPYQFGIEILGGPFQGVFLTDPTANFGFRSDFDGLPPSRGTIFENLGDDALLILGTFPNPNGPGTVQVPIGQTTNRFIEVVPEPSSVVILFGVAGVAAIAGRRYRRS